VSKESLLNEAGGRRQESSLTIDPAGLAENVPGLSKEHLVHMVDVAKA